MKTEINKFVMFAFNYPSGFIKRAFASLGDNMVNHIERKFADLYDRYGANAVMVRFYVELDSEKQKMLEDYITNEYYK